MPAETNKQRATALFKRPEDHRVTLQIEDHRIIFATLLAASTLKGRKKREFQKMIQEVIQRVGQDEVVNPDLFLSQEEARKLYEDAKDISKGKFHENPDWKIKLPANLTLSLGQAIGCGTSVFQGATKANHSFTTAFLVGLSTFGANLFFASQAVPELLSKMGVDCRDFASNRSFQLALILVGQELFRGLFVASAAGVDTTFAVHARNELGIGLVGYGQSIMTLFAMGLIYRDALQSLFDKIIHPLELCEAIVKAARGDSVALNIFRVISAAAGITRTVAFASVAKETYEHDMNFGRTGAIIAAITSLPPLAGLMTFATLDSANFFYERGVELASNIRGALYLAYQASSNGIRSIPLILPGVMRSAVSQQNNDFAELREETENYNNQQNTGMMTALCNIMGRLHPQIANYLPTILIMVVLIANAIGNVGLSDSENPLVLASIFWVSFSVCSKSIFKNKALESADELDRKIELLTSPTFDPENPQSLRDFFTGYLDLPEAENPLIHQPVVPEVSTAELSGSETSGIDADLSYYGVQQPDTPTLGDGRLSSEDSAQLDLQEVASTISSSSNSGNEGHEGRVVTVPALRTRSRSASPVTLSDSRIP
jgi:hypothetical protein